MIQVRLKYPEGHLVEGRIGVVNGGGVWVHIAAMISTVGQEPLGERVFVPFENVAYVVKEKDPVQEPSDVTPDEYGSDWGKKGE